ncbi:MAG: hypothetical protein U0703_25495 [Anaerolineae bacterium]
MAKVRCIGIGNLYRRDDGAGLYAAQRLRLESLPNLCVAEHDGEGASLLDAIAGEDAVILIDALRLARAPAPSGSSACRINRCRLTRSGARLTLSASPRRLSWRGRWGSFRRRVWCTASRARVSTGAWA